MLCITKRERVQCGSGWDARRILQPIARAIGKKGNAADRPSPRYHTPCGVMQSIPKPLLHRGELPPGTGQRLLRASGRCVFQLATHRHHRGDRGTHGIRRDRFRWRGVFFRFFYHLVALLTFCHFLLLVSVRLFNLRLAVFLIHLRVPAFFPGIGGRPCRT